MHHSVNVKPNSRWIDLLQVFMNIYTLDVVTSRYICLDLFQWIYFYYFYIASADGMKQFDLSLCFWTIQNILNDFNPEFQLKADKNHSLDFISLFFSLSNLNLVQSIVHLLQYGQVNNMFITKTLNTFEMNIQQLKCCSQRPTNIWTP